MIEPLRYFILDLGDQRSYFVQGPWLRRSKFIKQNMCGELTNEITYEIWC